MNKVAIIITAGFENPIILSAGVIKPVINKIAKTIKEVTSMGNVSLKKSTNARIITSRIITISIVIFNRYFF